MYKRQVINIYYLVGTLAIAAGDNAPSGKAHRELGLITIPPRFLHREGRMHRNVVQLANALKGIDHPLPLIFQLGFIVKMLQLAGAAGLINLSLIHI